MKDIDDTRESPSFKLMELLEERGAQVEYNDPYLAETPKTRKYAYVKHSVELTAENLRSFDCVLLAPHHSVYDMPFITQHSTLLIDTRNATKGCAGGNVVKA